MEGGLSLLPFFWYVLHKVTMLSDTYDKVYIVRI